MPFALRLPGPNSNPNPNPNPNPDQTGKDEEDLRKINEDRRVGGESDEDPLDGEFDEKLANNRSGAAPARKRGTRR